MNDSGIDYSLPQNRTECSQPGCSKSVPNHYWGKVKNDDWFFQKTGEAWCPDHHPSWVAQWRGRTRRK